MKFVRILVIVLAVAGAFVAGRWYAGRAPHGPERKVLYWVDPMHPAYKSDKPDRSLWDQPRRDSNTLSHFVNGLDLTGRFQRTLALMKKC